MARRSIDRLRTDTAAAASAELGPQPPFPGAVDFRILELLTARLCHELTGPIGAIDNGVELLLEEDPALSSSSDPASSGDPGFLRDAVALVSGSARRARTRLEF